MNKNDFESELKELMASMSEEEIEKTINALNGCKSVVAKKQNREKSDKAKLMKTVELHKAKLHYIRKDKKGTIKTLGATLLSCYDYDSLCKNIPVINETWWLYNYSFVSNGKITWFCDKDTVGKIRPIIVIDSIDGDLKPGEVFYINDEKFRLLSTSIAIKDACLEGSCTYPMAKYACSIMRFCIDGWYMKLISDNEKKQNNANGTGNGTQPML